MQKSSYCPRYAADHNYQRKLRKTQVYTSILFGLLQWPYDAALADGDIALSEVTVIGIAPLSGPRSDLRDVPADVETVDMAQLRRQRDTLADYLERNAAGIAANSGQGNPHQPDLLLRGFAASPLLGTPQGLAVFQDGVRINESFGDTVNWDLLPDEAIARVEIMPGSNPLFGLNALGGALAITTRDGRRFPGIDAEETVASAGLQALSVSAGGADEALDYFGTLHVADDRGWAAHNSSQLRQGFGKLGWQTEQTHYALGITAADNTLEGSQTLPRSMLDHPREPYTYPDANRNRLEFVSFQIERPGEDRGMTVSLYGRHYRNDNDSSNVNDDADDDLPALNDRSHLDQHSAGIGIQHTRDLGSHQLLGGASFDAGWSHFSQAEQPALFTPGRGTLGIDAFEDTTAAFAGNRYAALYAADVWHLGRWSLTVAGRYNEAAIKLADRSSMAPALDGNSTFRRFNPGLGLTFNPDPETTVYSTYNEGQRAPTPMELTCADPAAPCKLPNDFLADPPLQAVISKTLEAGARGSDSGHSWRAALYRTDLHRDIQFIGDGGASNAGYFANIGRTRRQGATLSGEFRTENNTLALHYDYIQATFLSSFAARSVANSTSQDGVIAVERGDTIPGIPTQTLKLRWEHRFDSKLQFGVEQLARSGVYARGDENNADANGRTPGYALWNADLSYRFNSRFETYARTTNIFNRRYTDFALLGDNVFTGPGGTFGPSAGFAPQPEQFRAPGTPRIWWLGVRYHSGPG